MITAEQARVLAVQKKSEKDIEYETLPEGAEVLDMVDAEIRLAIDTTPCVTRIPVAYKDLEAIYRKHHPDASKTDVDAFIKNTWSYLISDGIGYEISLDYADMKISW